MAKQRKFNEICDKCMKNDAVGKIFDDEQKKSIYVCKGCLNE